MFDIEYKGANAIVFATKKVRVVFDPNLAVAGAKNVSVKDSICLLYTSRSADSPNYTARFFRQGCY